MAQRGELRYPFYPQRDIPVISRTLWPSRGLQGPRAASEGSGPCDPLLAPSDSRPSYRIG